MAPLKSPLSSQIADGYCGKHSRSQMQRQDRICWSRQAASFCGHYIVEIRND